MDRNIPVEALRIMDELVAAGYEAYLVGGCVRDMLLGRVPEDYDIATNALPDEVAGLFNMFSKRGEFDGIVEVGKEHGTIGVIADGRVYEVTTYRIDGTYSDHRRPDEVVFASGLAEDVGRRDFTVNAMAMDRKGEIADYVGGLADLAREVLRAVGAPALRFREDALRIMRGIRFLAQLQPAPAGQPGRPAASAMPAPAGQPSRPVASAMPAPAGQPSRPAASAMPAPAGQPSRPVASAMPAPVGQPGRPAASAMPAPAGQPSRPVAFTMEAATAQAIHDNKALLNDIAVERIRVELDKLLLAPGAADVLREYRDVIAEIVPELAAGFDFDQQNPYHSYDVYEHTLQAIAALPLPSQDTAAALTVRLAALLHDIGKPACFVVKNGWGHFYGHEKKSQEMAQGILERLRYDKKTQADVLMLIKSHGTVFNLTESYAHRKLNCFGEERLRMLIALERADVSAQAPSVRQERIQMIDAFEKIVDKAIQDEQCFNLKDMAIDGSDLLALGFSPSPQLGRALNELLDKVLDGQLSNEREALLAAAQNIKKD